MVLGTQTKHLNVKPAPSQGQMQLSEVVDKVWKYGVGVEGVRRSKTTEDTRVCVMIGVTFPWWWSAVRAAELNVSSIWLISCSVIESSFISCNFCQSLPIHIGEEPPTLFLECLATADILFVDGKIPRGLDERFIWTSDQLSVVVATSRSEVSTHQGWREKVLEYNHNDLGGVTDGKVNIYMWSKLLGDFPLSTGIVKGHSRQDLRWILKAGVPGRRVYNFDPPKLGKAEQKVQYCSKGTIRSDGLLPFRNRDLFVRTEFGGNVWVDRTLTTPELMMAMDSPEQLVRMVSEAYPLSQLYQSITVPGKILQAAAQYCASLLQTPRTKSIRQKRPVLLYDELLQTVPERKRARLVVLNLSLMTERPNHLFTIPEADQPDNCTSCSNSLTSQRMYDPNAKATKNDSAEVRVSVWDQYLAKGLDPIVQARDYRAAAKVLRKFFLPFWKRNIYISFQKWKGEMIAEGNEIDSDTLEAAADCICRSDGTSWWSWDAGSRPIFWRWPKDFQQKIQKGGDVWFQRPVTHWKRKQRETRCPVRKGLIKEKLETIRSKGYVELGKISSLMSFFDVPKGSDDIRMVYDGTKSGLNDSLWAPWFPLPTIECLIRAVEPGYVMADNDVGEMFHNFMLHNDLREHCGLDISQYFGHEGTTSNRLWMRWNRLAMGLRSSPHGAVQCMLIAQEVILGDKDQQSNVFRWSNVRLNLPGSINYDPSVSWVSKLRPSGEVAADLFIYVDDVRCSAPTYDEAWQASQRVSTILGYLGLQDAARKRREPGLEPGAWTGSVVWTSNGSVAVLTTPEKWQKTKNHLQWIKDNMDALCGLDNTKMKSIRGFLVYVSRTYPSMVPYLKGVHATIDSWRPGRDSDGWKFKPSLKRKRTTPERGHPGVDFEMDALWYDPKFGMDVPSENEPTHVKPVPRLRKDIESLLFLASSKDPPIRTVRMSKAARVVYGFGDASKTGFGSSIKFADDVMIWRHGQWRLDEEYKSNNPSKDWSLRQESSSNYRELRNLVEALEECFESGKLDNTEVFMFTDNSTAEAAYFKGTSSSELLFDLVLRLRKLEMSGRCIIRLVHVSGTRMIWQGTDGLSRGDYGSGVMAGEAMTSYVPLHVSASDRSSQCIAWITTWCSNISSDSVSVILLSEKQWFDFAITPGIYIWVPPPAAAEVVVELMSREIHKRPTSIHIFLCPRLMTAYWQRMLRKATDIFSSIPVGSSIWGISQHEPLILAISFPLSRTKPWKYGGTPRCEHEGRILSQMLKEDIDRAGSMLRELSIRAWTLATV